MRCLGCPIGCPQYWSGVVFAYACCGVKRSRATPIISSPNMLSFLTLPFGQFFRPSFTPSTVGETFSLVSSQSTVASSSIANGDSKPSIKAAVESLFNVKVVKINTAHLPKKKKRVGQYTGWKPHYKKAIVTLSAGDTINLFAEEN